MDTARPTSTKDCPLCAAATDECRCGLSAICERHADGIAVGATEVIALQAQVPNDPTKTMFAFSAIDEDSLTIEQWLGNLHVTTLVFQEAAREALPLWDDSTAQLRRQACLQISNKPKPPTDNEKAPV